MSRNSHQSSQYIDDFSFVHKRWTDEITEAVLCGQTRGPTAESRALQHLVS